MNVFDLIIILVILFFGVIGFKHGFFKQTVLTVGTILLFVLSYYLKDYVADFLSYHLPFFDFPGNANGLISLNIILYQMIGFILVFAGLTFIYNIILKLTGVFEKALRITIVLGIPSKILGFIVGLIEGYVIAFILVFFLSQPVIKYDIINESSLSTIILESSPVLSDIVKDTNDAIGDIYVLIEEYVKNNDSHKLNVQAIDIMLKYKIVDTEYMDKLIESDKIDIPGITIVVDKYR